MPLKIGSEDFENYCDKRAQIERLEEQQTLRVMREALCGDEDALATLQSINTQIATLRSEMATIEGE